MSDDRAVDVVATALAYRDSSAVVGWSHKAEAQCALDALKAAGIAVVELPKPHANWDGSLTAWRVQQSWGGRPYRDGAVNIRVTDGKIIGDGVSNPSDCAADARSYAAALLAAADALAVSDE